MRSLFLAIIAFLPLSALADNYHWVANGTTRYSTALEACKSFNKDSTIYYMNPGATLAYCELGDGNLIGTVYRAGDTCPDGQSYNADSTKCEGAPEPEPSKCESRAGQQRKFQRRGTIGDGWFSVTSNGYGVHPQDNCVEGCQAWTEGVECKYNNLVGNVYLCRGTANLTGAECGTSGADSEETDNTTRPEPERIVDKKPCVYKTNADGTQSCESESSEYQDGQSCGEVNGVRRCIDKAPEKNGIDIRTNIKTEPTPDGGSKTTKTDVTTKTECKNGKCTTSTTTRTTTATKDGNGKTTSISGTCTGKDCKDANESPDGTGNGGVCVGANCSDDPFAEEGEMGQGGFYEPGEDTFESVLTEFQSGVTQLPVIDGVGNFLAFSPSGSCPTGSTSVWIFTIQADQWCGNTIPWDLIKAVVMGIAAFLAFRIAFL